MCLKRIKQKSQILNRPFRETVEANLYDIFVSFLVFSVLAFLLDAAAVLNSQSETDLSSVNLIFIVFVAVFCLSYWFFNLFYVAPRILSKIKRSRSMLKYNALRVRNRSVRTVLIGLSVSISSAFLFVSIAGAMGVKTESSLIFDKIRTIFLHFSVLLVLISLASSSASIPISTHEDVELSFDIIQDFDKIASEMKPSQTPCDIWNFCMRYILNDLEREVKQQLGISEDLVPSFYKPFSVVSLAAVIGDDKQRRTAKEWIADLGKIVTSHKTKDTTKTRLIIEHLEKADKDSNFQDFQHLQEKYGFQHDFSSGWKRLKALSRNQSIALFLVPIIELIVGIVLKYF